MTKKTKKGELFFLVEYIGFGRVERQDLFSSSKKAKDFIKDHLYFTYDRGSRFWTCKDSVYYAEIITLICK